MTRALLVLLMCCLLGCSGRTKPEPEKALLGSWRLYDLLPTDENSGGDELLQAARRKQVAAKGLLLSLFPDSSYSELSGDGGYRYGTWKLGDGKLHLKPAASDEENFELSFQESGTKELVLLRSKSGEGRQFLRDASPLEAFRQDPFYPANNSWRLRPSATESDAQLTGRFGGYIRHLACLLQASDTRKEEVVSFEFSKGPVKIYNGGIGIHPMHIVPDTWLRSFYDEQDAFRAYRLYEQYLQGNSYRGAGTGRWVVDDYNILLSIYADLKDGKFTRQGR